MYFPSIENDPSRIEPWREQRRKEDAEDEDIVRLFLQGVAYKVARGEICEIGI